MNAEEKRERFKNFLKSCGATEEHAEQIANYYDWEKADD